MGRPLLRAAAASQGHTWAITMSIERQSGKAQPVDAKTAAATGCKMVSLSIDAPSLPLHRSSISRGTHRTPHHRRTSKTEATTSKTKTLPDYSPLLLVVHPHFVTPSPTIMAFPPRGQLAGTRLISVYLIGLISRPQQCEPRPRRTPDYHHQSLRADARPAAPHQVSPSYSPSSPNHHVKPFATPTPFGR